MPYETQRRSRGKDPFLINLDDRGTYVVNITPRSLYPGTNWIKRWVGMVKKFDPRTVQHVASRVGICAALHYTQKRINELNN